MMRLPKRFLGLADIDPFLRERYEILASIPDREKIELLLRIVDGDALVPVELRNKLRKNFLDTCGTPHRRCIADAGT
jgi:hypothetical protein